VRVRLSGQRRRAADAHSDGNGVWRALREHHLIWQAALIGEKNMKKNWLLWVIGGIAVFYIYSQSQANNSANLLTQLQNATNPTINPAAVNSTVPVGVQTTLITE
jgi:hypothetical protein